MPTGQPLIVVWGADGFVGSALAAALGARRVVFGAVRDGDVHVRDAEDLVRRADVVVNCSGFRVRPGCGIDDYRRSHEGAARVFVPWLRPGALLLHMSSASVLGRGEGLGNRAPPRPDDFPSPPYARAKHEEDLYLERESDGRGFRVIFLRAAVVYSAQGAGMVGTMLRLARKGIALRLFPRDARHHLVHMDLLAEVARRVVARPDLPSKTYLVVADPYVVTNRELEAMIRPALPPRSLPLAMPVHWLAAVLRFGPRSRHPALDLRTRGEIFGVLAMDTVYDPSETFRLLGIDPARYGRDATLEPVVRGALAA